MHTCSATHLGHTLTMEMHRMGDGLCLLCYGGSAPHVGAASLAQPYTAENGAQTASVSGCSALGHRDVDLGNLLAARAAKATGRTVAAVCGVHYPNLAPEHIAGVLDACLALCDRLLEDFPE